MVEYFATLAKILSKVARNILDIFHPCHQKILKIFQLVHMLMFTFIGSQYNNPDKKSK
jgi:hypothetical protein